MLEEKRALDEIRDEETRIQKYVNTILLEGEERGAGPSDFMRETGEWLKYTPSFWSIPLTQAGPPIF